jgi:hypothetical protein
MMKMMMVMMMMMMMMISALMQTADVDQQAPEWHARACTEHNTALVAQQHPCKTSTGGRKLLFAAMRHAA